MNMSQVLLSACLNLSIFFSFFLSAVSSSTVKAQMRQQGHLGRHGAAVGGDSARPTPLCSATPILAFLFVFCLCGIVHM